VFGRVGRGDCDGATIVAAGGRRDTTLGASFFLDLSIGGVLVGFLACAELDYKPTKDDMADDTRHVAVAVPDSHTCLQV